jgi:hypothetical protein
MKYSGEKSIGKVMPRIQKMMRTWSGRLKIGILDENTRMRTRRSIIAGGMPGILKSASLLRGRQKYMHISVRSRVTRSDPGSPIFKE